MALVAALATLTLAMLTFTMRDYLLRVLAGECSTSGVQLLFALGADPNRAGLLGPPLHHAVRCGDTAMIALMLRHGADVDGPDRRNGFTALMIASATGNRRAVTLLLDHGAKINGVIPGASPLRLAARSNRVGVVTDLLARGAKPAHGGAGVVSELHIAAADVVPVLVAAGIPLEGTNHWGETPVFSAARQHDRKLGALIEAGAHVNVTNNKGATPLMEALRECRSSGVRLLVAAGADVRVRDRGGKSPLEMATKCSNGGEIISMLFTLQTSPAAPAERSPAYP